MRRPLTTIELADLLSPHRWEEQVHGDASRHGCRTCGGERWFPSLDKPPLFRAPSWVSFISSEPECKSTRSVHLKHGNPENARRAERVADLHTGAPVDLAPGERCPSCGYGSSVSEQFRYINDARALHEIERGRAA